jgi:hypothetical protein
LNIFFKIIFTTIIGAILGFSYYHFIGCNSGSCAITSQPINSTLYGAFMGFFWCLPDFWTKKEIRK